MTFTIVLIGWIFSLCLHEFSHAIVAYSGGDYTVREKGYLSFNPLKYTHPIFSIVLPIIFLRFLSLRYDRRRAELEALVADKNSDYYGDKATINDPDEYRRVGAFVIPEAARWENIRRPPTLWASTSTRSATSTW